jgi:general secretion pathway protein M
MSDLPEGIRGKALAFSIAALLLFALYLAIVMPLVGYYDASAQVLRDRRDVLKRYESAVQDLPRLRAQGQKNRQQSGNLLLTGSSDAVTAAALQSTLKDLVEADGATLESAQTLPAEKLGNFRRVGVRLSFSGSLELLTSVLLGVETANPVLSIGALELHSSDEEAGQDLTIAMDVYGFRSQ